MLLRPIFFLNDNNLRLDSDDFIVEDYSGKVTKINDAHCVDVIIKKPVKEMTISEIEEKLGYKIKIINENGESQ